MLQWHLPVSTLGLVDIPTAALEVSHVPLLEYFGGGYEAGSCSEQGLPAPVMPLLVSEAEGSGSPSVLASPQSPHPISSLQLCAS